MEEIGRAVAPVPFFTSAVLATTALLKAGETEVLGQLAAGGIRRLLWSSRCPLHQELSHLLSSNGEWTRRQRHDGCRRRRVRCSCCSGCG